ncbi:AsmA family protein [bacterium]|nr:AsmA family protein [bacterium]
MKRFFSVLGKSFLVLLLLICFLIGGIYIFRNTLIHRAIDGAGAYALGTDTNIESVDVDLRHGHIVLKGLIIANPPGFDESPFLDIERIEIAFHPRSILTQSVRISYLSLKGVSLYLDKHEGTSNYEFILNHIQSLDSTSANTETKQSGALIIDKLILEDIKVSATLLPLGGDVTRCNYGIDKIELKNLGTDEEEGLSTHQVFGIVTKALFSSALQIGGKVLPGPIRNGLNFALTPVWNLGELGINVVAFTVGGAVDVASFMGKGILNVGKGLGKGIIGIGKAIIPGGSEADSLKVEPAEEKK